MDQPLQRLKFFILLLAFICLGKLSAQNCEHIGLVGTGFLVGEFECEQVIITFDSALVLQPTNRLEELAMGSFIQFSYEVLDSVGCSSDIPLVHINCLESYSCNFAIESFEIDSAENQSFRLEIFNQTDFGPYHPQTVEWYEYETGNVLGDDSIIIYQPPLNSPPVVNICADFEVIYPDDSFCSGTLCELLVIDDFMPEVMDCQAFFGYLPHDFTSSGAIDFFNYSLGSFSEATWDFGDGQTLVSTSETISHTFDTPGLYNVCLAVSGESTTCASTFCLPVFTISGSEICNYNDCVLPGDANKDSTINIFDVLALGVGFNSTGKIRPNAVIDPIPQAAFDWTDFLDQLNFKHIDCDGNGLINEADYTAIDQNYLPIKEKAVLSIDPSLPIVSLRFETDTLLVNPSQTIRVPVTLEVGLITDFYGLALALDYKGATIQDIETTYDETSFLGDSNDILAKQKNLKADNQLGVAITRTNQIAVTGAGKIAEVAFIVIADLIEGRTTVIELDLNDLKAINSRGEIIPVSTDAKNPTIVIIADSMSVNINNQLLDRQLEVYPNPTKAQLSLILSEELNLEDGIMEIFNTLGQRILTQQFHQHQTFLDLKKLESGVYWIKVHTKEGIGTRAFIVE